MTNLQPQPQHVSEADLDLLSAYLDNQLAAAERIALERRLQADPHLRAELAELRTTVALLHELPPVPLPRSFTLDPARVPRRRSFGFPLRIWSLGSGLVGLLLLLMVSTQLLNQPATSTSSYGSATKTTVVVSSFGANEEAAPQVGAAGGSMSSPVYGQATAGVSSAFDASTSATAQRQAEAPAAAAATAVLPNAPGSSSPSTIELNQAGSTTQTEQPAPSSANFLSTFILLLGGVLGLALLALAAWGLRRS